MSLWIYRPISGALRMSAYVRRFCGWNAWFVEYAEGKRLFAFLAVKRFPFSAQPVLREDAYHPRLRSLRSKGVRVMDVVVSVSVWVVRLVSRRLKRLVVVLVHLAISGGGLLCWLSFLYVRVVHCWSLRPRVFPSRYRYSTSCVEGRRRLLLLREVSVPVSLLDPCVGSKSRQQHLD